MGKENTELITLLCFHNWVHNIFHKMIKIICFCQFPVTAVVHMVHNCMFFNTFRLLMIFVFTN
jgi:hypothetical protein